MKLSIMTTILSASLMFAGCSSSVKQLETQSLLPEIDIVQLKENSDEALKLAQEAKLDVQVVNTKLAELDNRVMILSEEVSSVSLAKIEEIENRLSLLIEAYKDLQEQMSTLQILPRVQSTAKNAPTFSPSAASGILTSSEYEIYQNALKIFNDRNYPEARKNFLDMTNKFPDGVYASNAYYWIGECYYAEAKFAEGISAFTKVLEFPKTTKADDAQLKIGLSFLKMGNKAKAREALNTLVSRYPNSEFVTRAKEYIAGMKQ
jgi:tol-pal system protein YbgF